MLTFAFGGIADHGETCFSTTWLHVTHFGSKS